MFDTNYINLSVKKDLNELVLGQFSLQNAKKSFLLFPGSSQRSSNRNVRVEIQCSELRVKLLRASFQRKVAPILGRLTKLFHCRSFGRKCVAKILEIECLYLRKKSEGLPIGSNGGSLEETRKSILRLVYCELRGCLRRHVDFECTRCSGTESELLQS